jgi:hypothetical protein
MGRADDLVNCGGYRCVQLFPPRHYRPIRRADRRPPHRARHAVRAARARGRQGPEGEG